MIATTVEDPGLDRERLRAAIREEYEWVAREPGRGFHFHTGRHLAHLLGYADGWLAGIPEASIASFAGTGNPFSMGELRPGERVVDVGSGAGMDSMIAARMVGPSGRVIGVDMTQAMLEIARAAAAAAGIGGLGDFPHGGADLSEKSPNLPIPASSQIPAIGSVCQVEFREGYAEALPVPDSWADVVISNGVLNLMPDKPAALQEMARVLKPAGRLQIADILVERPVSKGSKHKIDLWTG